MSDQLLITGGTGFIGARLVRRWLSGSDARLTLLVRPHDSVPPAERVRRILVDLGDENGAEEFGDRLRIVEGDLTRPRLGISEPEYEALTGDITQIVHAGADVRFDP